VYVEELGTFPSASPVLRLMATLQSGEGVPCRFRATGNPGGPGHQWVKARYIDPNPAGWEIRKFTFENPWTRETTSRIASSFRARCKTTNFSGQGTLQTCEQHVVESFEVPAHWARFCSMDWGSAKPFSVGWWTIVSDDSYAPRPG
jgi:hypothetical protein